MTPERDFSFFHQEQYQVALIASSMSLAELIVDLNSDQVAGLNPLLAHNANGITHPFWGMDHPAYCGHPGFHLDFSGDAPFMKITCHHLKNWSSRNSICKVEHLETIEDSWGGTAREINSGSVEIEEHQNSRKSVFTKLCILAEFSCLDRQDSRVLYLQPLPLTRNLQKCIHISFKPSLYLSHGDAPVIKISEVAYQVLEIKSMSRVHLISTEYTENICSIPPVNSTFDSDRFSYASNTKNIMLYYGCPTIPSQFLPTLGLSYQFSCNISRTDMVGYYLTRNLSMSATGSFAANISSYLESLVDGNISLLKIPDPLEPELTLSAFCTWFSVNSSLEMAIFLLILSSVSAVDVAVMLKLANSLNPLPSGWSNVSSKASAPTGLVCNVIPLAKTPQ
ncbi:hypothetical protein NC653_038493 [Populus alba x Populus x berolinensis]|uniref:Uncharacterized protein n=1 Tax=Populus alba x Populus x berolinensis TaxID=444605 RepID=A0AAD6PU97_9ROSI|nr:hypothetical protein NC653_038493 [Populus alba x Populus x berolinensis]